MKLSIAFLTISNHHEWCLTNLSLRLRNDTHRSATSLRWASQTPNRDDASPVARIESYFNNLSITMQATWHLRPAHHLLVVSLATDVWPLWGQNPVKLNIRWDRIAAICLYESCSNETCCAGNTFIPSEGEVCLKSIKTKTINNIWINERSEFGEANYEVH